MVPLSNLWSIGCLVRTPPPDSRHGIVRSFDQTSNMVEVQVDWFTVAKPSAELGEPQLVEMRAGNILRSYHFSRLRFGTAESEKVIHGD
jgi:hypothetical protein